MVDFTPELESKIINTLKEANLAISREYHQTPDKVEYLRNATGALATSVCIELYNKFEPYFQDITPPELKDAILSILKDYFTNHETHPAAVVTFLDHVNLQLINLCHLELLNNGALNTVLRGMGSTSTHPLILKLTALLNHTEEYTKLTKDYKILTNFISKLNSDCRLLGASEVLETYSKLHNINLAV